MHVKSGEFNRGRKLGRGDACLSVRTSLLAKNKRSGGHGLILSGMNARINHRYVSNHRWEKGDRGSNHEARKEPLALAGEKFSQGKGEGHEDEDEDEDEDVEEEKMEKEKEKEKEEEEEEGKEESHRKIGNIEHVPVFRYNGGMVRDGAFFIEPFTADFFRNFHIEKIIYEGKTKQQLVHIFANRVFGKVLFLDRRIQSAEIDEFIFHECLVHPGLLVHPAPRKVLILGGGEGATLRETLRHPSVSRATMIDIDRQLVALCRRYLPEWSRGAFSNRRSRLLFQDARQFVEKTEERFDVIISDLTEPLEGGPSVYLFTLEFFRRVAQVLSEDGVFVLQAGSTDPHYHRFFSSLSRTLREVFPVVRPYWAFMFSFGLPWGFVLASKRHDPVTMETAEIGRRFQERKLRRLRYLHPAMFSSLFVLPVYLLADLEKADVLTDEKPFIWQA